MQHKINEIFELDGEWYQCLKGSLCTECAFRSTDKCHLQHCTPAMRTDDTSVIYQKLKEKGEPITSKGRTFQKLKINNLNCNNCVFYTSNQTCCKDDYIEDICGIYDLWVEIKQNQEDMEKNKKLHLKEFDIEEAKKGKPVYTRSGKKARIICFDAKGDKPIIALIEYEMDERPCNYSTNGKFYSNFNENNDADLMMLPEKKEGWIVIHKEAIYDKETAEKIARETTANVIRIQKIEWEE